MSVRCSGAVWQYSQAKGGERLVLLAIADHAKHDGSGAWPSLATLCTMTKFSERNVRYCLRRLEESGELVIEYGTGPHGANLYRVVLAGWEPDLEEPEGQRLPPAKIAPGKMRQRRGAKIAGEGGKVCREGGQPIAPDPSLTVHEPSKEPSSIPRVRAAPKPRDVAGTKRPPDPVWDSLVAGIGYAPQTTQERKRFGKATAELKLCGAAPDDIRQRCEHYRRRWPTMELTPEALIKHWSRLEDAPGRDVPLWKRVKVWD